MSSDLMVFDANASLEKTLLEKEKAKIAFEFKRDQKIEEFLWSAFRPVKNTDQNLSIKN